MLKAEDKNGCRLLSTILLRKAAMTDICFSKYQIGYINQSFTVSVSVTPGDCLYSQAALKAHVLSCKIKSNSPAITTLKILPLQLLFFFKFIYFLKKKKGQIGYFSTNKPAAGSHTEWDQHRSCPAPGPLRHEGLLGWVSMHSPLHPPSTEISLRSPRTSGKGGGGMERGGEEK